MASLILSGQATAAIDNDIVAKKIISAARDRKEAWQKLGDKGRAEWLDSGDDKVLEQIYTIYIELKDLFEGKKVTKEEVAPRVVAMSSTVAFTDWSRSPILNAAKALFA